MRIRIDGARRYGLSILLVLPAPPVLHDCHQTWVPPMQIFPSISEAGGTPARRPRPASHDTAGWRRSISVFGRSLRVALLAAAAALGVASAQAGAETLRFAVGPFQPTASDTRTAFEPFFAHIAKQLGVRYSLTVTNDWAGIAIALANGQADVAWMGPWGYVLAHNEGGAQAIATVKYQGRPTYHAIIIARPALALERFPEDAKGLRISFADAGSTSGWLIPHYWFMSRGIEPRSYFQYRDGASHAANVIAVSSGQTDLATDFDRNLDAMIDRGAVKPGDVKVVWKSDPLPNDPLVVRKGLDPALTARLREIVTAIDGPAAGSLLPKNYTGWIAADHASYKVIEDAGQALGKLRKR